MGIDRDRNQPTAAAELRRRAEEHLRAVKTESRTPRTEAESQRLLHELEIHRIELEMQNAELRQARDGEAAALEKYADLFDFAPVGYFTLDREGIIRSLNLIGASLLGGERSRLLGRRFGLFVADEDRPAFADFLVTVFTSSTEMACEVSLLKEGHLPLYVQIEALAAASGQECRIALIDITGRKLMENALRDSEDRLHLLIDGAKDYAIIMLDIDGRVTSWNEGAKRLKGWDAQEVLGRHFSLFYTADAVASGHPEYELKIAAAEGRYAEEGWRVHKNGSKFMADVVITAIRDDSGKLRGFSKITRDITERKLAEKSLRQAKEGAEAANRAKSQFLVNMSHELRTQMTGLLGMLQLALQEDIAPAPRGYLETSLSSARALLCVLNDILIMAKIEEGKLTIEEKPFSPQRCISEVVDLITPEVQRKGLDFVVSVAEEVPDMAVGDQARLRQVLANLIGNAVKFTDGGKVEVRVTAERVTSDGKREFTFAVTDTGIGIPDDKKELLFRAFSQVDASLSRRFGGTGLGLAISREIVELMGGTISFKSEEWLGSTFSFTVPLGDTGLEGNALTKAEPQSAETTAPAREGVRIPRLLIAEDDQPSREVMGLILKRLNYSIDFAENGLKAVELWGKSEYDLVLMDVQMPRLNGLEATRAIREKELERGGHTPIVAMTAHARKEDEEGCLAAGMDAYISKPIDFKKCIEMIEKFAKPFSHGGFR